MSKKEWTIKVPVRLLIIASKRRVTEIESRLLLESANAEVANATGEQPETIDGPMGMRFLAEATPEMKVSSLQKAMISWRQTVAFLNRMDPDKLMTLDMERFGAFCGEAFDIIPKALDS